MKLALLIPVAIALLGVASLVAATRNTGAGTVNTMTLDLDPATPGIEASRLVPSGAEFDFAIVASNVTQPYIGYQWESEWPDAGLNFISNVENTAGGGNLCAQAIATTDPGAGVPPGQERVLGGCILSGGTTSFAGTLVTITAQCQSDGTHAIDLVGMNVDEIFGSAFLGEGGTTQPTALGPTALLSCGILADTPTPTFTSTSTRTPTPTFTPSPTPSSTPTPSVTPCTPGELCDPTPIPAGPTDIIIIGKSTCIATFTGLLGVPALGCLDSPQGMDASLSFYEHDIGDGDGVIEPEDFDQADLDANQLHDTDGYAYIIVFVEGDQPLTFSLESGAGRLNVGSSDVAIPPPFVCSTVDEDCDGDGIAGNGVVVVAICTGSDAIGCGGGQVEFGPSERGEHTLTVAGNALSAGENYTIVGDPVRVEVRRIEPLVENGVSDLNMDGDFNDPGECEFPGGFPSGSVQPLIDVTETAPRTLLVASVRDSDGTRITGAWVEWSTNDESIGAMTGVRQTPSLQVEFLGEVAPQIFCGTLGTGISTIEARTVPGPLAGLSYIFLDPNHGDASDTVEIEVVDAFTPTPTLTATPIFTPSPTATPSPTNTNTPSPVPTATHTPTPAAGTPCADVTGDGVVTFDDVRTVVRHLGKRRADPAYDLNGDGRVTGRDLALTIRQLGTACPN